MGAARATAVAGEELELAILGPLEVRRAGAVLPLPGLRPRALLAVLVVNANRVLSAERLIDELWGDGPPPSARSALQVHVATLRRALGAGHNLATVAGG